jgi:hypothetical protein
MFLSKVHSAKFFMISYDNTVFIGSNSRSNMTRLIGDKDLFKALNGELGPGDFCYVPEGCVPPRISMYID